MSISCFYRWVFLFDDPNINNLLWRKQKHNNLYIMAFILIYLNLKHTFNTEFKGRSFWKQRTGETSHTCWSSDNVSCPVKNHRINFLHQRRYINIKMSMCIYEKRTCSSWYEMKVVFMKNSNNPYFDDDVFWH